MTETSSKRTTLAWLGGLIAGAIVIAIGIAYLVMGLSGRSEVKDTLSRELIVGTPDMKPGGGNEAAAEKYSIALPNCDVAGKKVENGADAKCFAGYMRVHALESTEGRTYAQMGRFLDAEGNDTSDEAKAAKNPQTGRPVDNPLRQLWVTERALATGLEMSFFAEQVSLFSVITGILAIIVGIGLWVIVLAMWGTSPWKAGAAPKTE